jgi:outer membrane protein W
MNKLAKAALAALALTSCVVGSALPAAAGDEHGNFMVRTLVTVVDPDTDATVRAGGTVIPGADADASTEVIPALTQAGFDVSIGNGWYLNADVKKTWLDTEISWNGTGVRADADLDPWIFSAGLGYRFNLGDIFGHRAQAASMPIK